MANRVSFATVLTNSKRFGDALTLFGDVFGGNVIDVEPTPGAGRTALCRFFEPGAGEADVRIVKSLLKFQKIPGLGLELIVPDLDIMLTRIREFANSLKGIVIEERMVLGDTKCIAVRLNGLIAGEIILFGTHPAITPSTRVSNVFLRVDKMPSGYGIQVALRLFRDVFGWSGVLGNSNDNGVVYDSSGMEPVRIDLLVQPSRARVIPNDGIGIAVGNPVDTAYDVQKWLLADSKMAIGAKVEELSGGQALVTVPRLLKTPIVLVPES